MKHTIFFGLLLSTSILVAQPVSRLRFGFTNGFSFGANLTRHITYPYPTSDIPEAGSCYSGEIGWRVYKATGVSATLASAYMPTTSGFNIENYTFKRAGIGLFTRIPLSKNNEVKFALHGGLTTAKVPMVTTTYQNIFDTLETKSYTGYFIEPSVEYDHNYLKHLFVGAGARYTLSFMKAKELSPEGIYDEFTLGVSYLYFIMGLKF